MSVAARSVLFSVASIGMMIAMAVTNTVNAHATDGAGMQPDPTVIALEIEPVCSSEAQAHAVWKVTNKNANPVHIDWNNTQNGLTGGYDAPNGVTTMYTGYVASDPNNTTQFAWAGNLTQTNATKATCDDEPTTPTPVDCIDGHIQQNLVINWLNENTVSVMTQGGKPLCEDVTIYFSSYTMPSNYNGQGFYGNPTAYPQPIHDSVSATLAKGTNGEATLAIALPNRCENIQVDVYYAPEITTVNENGHGTQNIESKVYLSQNVCEQPGQGSGETTPPVTPETPTMPPVQVQPGMGGGEQTTAPTAPAMPATLPETGSSTSPLLWPLVSAVLTYLGMYAATVIRRRA